MKVIKTSSSESGISLLEVMIAGIVLVSGMLIGVLPMVSYGVSTMRAVDEETIAKQKARQILESIYGARNSSEMGWDSVNAPDVCKTNGTTKVCGVFLKGPQPMNESGSDGILGTADDADAGIETFAMADGQVRTLNEMKRTITISDYAMPDGSILPTLRNLKVEISYPVGKGLTGTYSIQSLISQYK